MMQKKTKEILEKRKRKRKNSIKTAIRWRKGLRMAVRWKEERDYKAKGGRKRGKDVKEI
jgi:hypothetical protein